LPSKVAEMVELAANPWPLMVTVEPGLAEVGLSCAAGVIVSWWAAVAVEPALFVTWTVYVPAAMTGVVQLWFASEPLEFEVIVHEPRAP
jgi:hypothetical protein